MQFGDVQSSPVFLSVLCLSSHLLLLFLVRVIITEKLCMLPLYMKVPFSCVLAASQLG